MVHHMCMVDGMLKDYKLKPEQVMSIHQRHYLHGLERHVYLDNADLLLREMIEQPIIAITLNGPHEDLHHNYELDMDEGL